MKLSKRAGALLLAVGAGVLTAQGVAVADEVTPGQVAAIENELATKEVPFDIPLGAATDMLPLLPEGGRISGGVPTSILMPPVPEADADKHLMPKEVIPSVNAGRVGPALQAVVPLPTADRSTDLGDLKLDAPAAPVHTAGPALTLGEPVSWIEGNSGELADGALAFGEVDPQLITAPVQAIPGAKASLGGDDKRISITDSLKNLTGATTGTVGGVLDQTQS